MYKLILLLCNFLYQNKNAYIMRYIDILYIYEIRYELHRGRFIQIIRLNLNDIILNVTPIKKNKLVIIILYIGAKHI